MPPALIDITPCLYSELVYVHVPTFIHHKSRFDTKVSVVQKSYRITCSLATFIRYLRPAAKARYVKNANIRVTRQVLFFESVDLSIVH